MTLLTMVWQYKSRVSRIHKLMGDGVVPTIGNAKLIAVLN
jgi:hypothetical protein